MSRAKQLPASLPTKLAKLRLPKVLDDRLHHLLDEQGRRGSLSAAERKEVKALAELSATLSMVKLHAQTSWRAWNFI